MVASLDKLFLFKSRCSDHFKPENSEIITFGFRGPAQTGKFEIGRELSGFCSKPENVHPDSEPAKQKIKNVNRKLFLTMPNNHKNHINPAVAHLPNDS